MQQQLGRHDEAAAAFGSAVRLAPSDSTFLHSLGGAFLVMGGHRAGEAMVHLKRAHAQQPASVNR